MKNKVLIVIPSLKLGGGAEKSATLVGNELYKKGYEISYLTFYQSEKKYDFFGSELCLNEKITNNIFKNIFKLFYRAYNIKKYCKKNNINTVISHLEEANFSNIISKLFLNKSKIIVVTHNTILSHNLINKFFIFILYRFSNKVITVAKEIIIQINQLYINNALCIYNGFDIHNIIEKGKEDLGEYKKLFNNGKFIFINIGRLTKQKNQKILLEAFDKINQKYNDTQLLILHGDGELEQDLKKQRELLVSKEHIYFLGNQKNPFNFLKKSDCFVLSSDWEGFGMVLVESMINGLPIISTDCPVGPKEIIGANINDFEEVKEIKKSNYGILVPNNDLDNLYEAMEMIYLDEDLRNNYKIKSLERSKDFDINNIIKEWEDII